jgi:hypothetical protein
MNTRKSIYICEYMRSDTYVLVRLHASVSQMNQDAKHARVGHLTRYMRIQNNECECLFVDMFASFMNRGRSTPLCATGEPS